VPAIGSKKTMAKTPQANPKTKGQQQLELARRLL
jgi:hypothetical protein